MARHRARQQALQLLFQWDQRRTPIEEILSGYYGSPLVSEDKFTKPRPDAFAEELLRGVVGELSDIDARIERHAEHWRIPRMPAVDRNGGRLAVAHVLRTNTPPGVASDG